VGTPSKRERLGLQLQLAISRLLSPIWVPALAAVMGGPLGWRIEGRAELRRRYAELRRSRSGPLLLCANHLTMLDSFVIGWALGSPAFYLRDFGALPWNTPERQNFASTWWKRGLAYLLKCVPLERGADRVQVARVLDKVVHLLRRGQTVLIFPEGGRSRSGRVELESAAYGVGRIVRALPGCQVLCVYLRGAGQQSWSDAPRRKERFRGRIRAIEPKSDQRGLRGSVEVARQIVATLVEMEREHFHDRQ